MRLLWDARLRSLFQRILSHPAPQDSPCKVRKPIFFCYYVFKLGGAYSVLVGGPEGKTQLGKSVGRWEDDIKTDIPEMGCGFEMDLSYL